MKKWTVIVDYNDGSGSTWMGSVEAETAEEACDEARKEVAETYLTDVSDNGIEPEEGETVESTILAQAMEYDIIACIEGEHRDVKP